VGTTNTKCLRVLIAYDNGHVYEWLDADAEKWVSVANTGLFVMENHGMKPNVPKPTRETVVGQEESK
jgi:hypothetical protein